MCHDLDFDLLRIAYQEELARRGRRQEVVKEKPEAAPAPAKPAAAPAIVRDKEPVPA